MRLRVITVLCILLWATTGIARAQETSTFSEYRLTEPPSTSFGSAAVADFDQDGDLDLVLTGLVKSEDHPMGIPHAERYSYEGVTVIEVLLPTGEPVNVDAVDFQEITANETLTPVWKSAMAIGDYNADNYADLAISGLTPGGIPTLFIYAYKAGSRQLGVFRSLDGLYSGDLDWGDMDNDGDLDLAACGLDSNGRSELRVYVNENNSFSPLGGQTAFTGVGVCSLEWGDYDVDGDMDLLVAGIDGSGNFLTRIYDNNGSGGFANSSHNLTGFGWPSAAWGDFDADGDLDILLSGARLTPMLLEGTMKIYRNNAGVMVDDSDKVIEGAFENDLTLGRYDGMVSWADYENSGYYGFAITGLETPRSTETLQLYRSDDGMRFRRSGVNRFDGGVRGSAIWADFDLDLDIDLLVVGESRLREGENTIRIWRNTLLFGLLAPEKPDVVDVSVSGRNATLIWSGASDRQTPAPGLTYNVRVGTTPGGTDVMSPLSDLDTGTRFVAERGNVGHNTRWILKNLDPGTYYWSVQALDQTYTGSEFTEEAVFTIEQ